MAELGPFITGGASVLNGFIGAIAGQAANETNIQQAREARDWQEKMYNKYYSPQAMMRQYEDAGLNPYMLGQNNGGVGQSAMPTSPVASVNPVNPLSGTDSAINSILQQQQLSINAKSAQADFAMKLATAFSEAYKVGGKKGVNQLFSVLEPAIANVDFDEGVFAKEAKSRIYNMDMNSLLTEFQYETGKNYTPQQKKLEFENLAAQTKQLFNTIELQGSEIVLNKAQANVTSSQIAKNFAEAFSAKKVGDYYEVNAKQMEIINDMLDLQLQDAQAEFAFNTDVRKWKKEIPNRSKALGLFLGGIQGKNVQLGIQGNKFLQYGKEVTSMVGNMFKVNFGLSTNRTNFNNMNPEKPSTMFYSGDGFYLNDGTLLKGNW